MRRSGSGRRAAAAHRRPRCERSFHSRSQQRAERRDACASGRGRAAAGSAPRSAGGCAHGGRATVDRRRRRAFAPPRGRGSPAARVRCSRSTHSSSSWVIRWRTMASSEANGSSISSSAGLQRQHLRHAPRACAGRRSAGAESDARTRRGPAARASHRPRLRGLAARVPRMRSPSATFCAGRAPGQQRVVLEQHADPRRAARPARRVPATGCQQAHHGAQDRALARARRPDQADELALADAAASRPRGRARRRTRSTARRPGALSPRPRPGRARPATSTSGFRMPATRCDSATRSSAGTSIRTEVG